MWSPGAEAYTFKNFTDRELDFRYPDPDTAVRRLGHYYNSHSLHFHDTITMFSGRELKVDFDTAEMCFSFEDGPYYFHTWYKEDKGIPTIKFAADTRDRNGINRPHPDLFAGRLMTRSIAFSEERLTGGQPLRQLSACWLNGTLDESSPSDNYIQFEQGLEAGLSTEAAAFSTWTGRQALKHGFTQINSIRNDTYSWLVDFVRPKRLWRATKILSLIPGSYIQ